MSCILQGGSRAVEAAKFLGVSLPPMLNEFCNPCGKWHMIIIPAEHSDQRFGRPPVDVLVQEADTYKDKPYCHTCHAYHKQGEYCGGKREVQNWEDKQI